MPRADAVSPAPEFRNAEGSDATMLTPPALSRVHRFPRLASVSALIVWAATGGCGSGGERIETITETREVAHPVAPSDPSLTTAERLGARPQGRAAQGGGGMGMPAAAPVPYAWDAPDAWTSLPPTQFRLANFAIGEVECFLSALPGAAGGVKENLDRWRGQMSQPPYTDAEFAALRRGRALGAEAVFVEIDGVYTGMAGETQLADYTMLGMIAPHEGRTVFVKMVGPTAAVAAERARFEAFCASLRAADGPAPMQPTPPGTDLALPAGHPPASDAVGATAEGAAPAEIAWVAPEGWQRMPDRPMRLATFSLGPDATMECVVSLWDGRMGGEAANVNLWRSQFGADPLDDAAAAALPRIDMLGTTGVLVELMPDDGGEALGGPALIGAICVLPEFSVFVKMTGDAREVASQREALIAFCGSMRVKE